MGLVGKIWDAVSGFLESAGKWFFENVLGTVVGTAALPFVGVIILVLNVLLQLVSSVMTVLSSGASAILTMQNVGGAELFSVIFTGYDVFYNYLRIFAFGLLTVIFIFQLVKTMAAPPGENTDSTGALVLKFMAIGMLLPNMRIIVGAVMTVFQTFIDAMCGIFKGIDHSGANFNAFVLEAQDFVTDTFSNMVSIQTQLVTLILTLFLLIMVCGIGKKLIRMLVEMIHRYVVLQVIVLTSPLAATLFLSKSTKKSAGKWIQMLLSQLILLGFSVMFLNVFFLAFNSFAATAAEMREQYGTVSSFVLAVLWAWMVYALLSVGTKMDTWLRKLGLSAGDSAAGFSAALFSEGSHILSAGQFAVGAIATGAEVFGTAGRYVGYAADYVRRTSPIAQRMGLSPAGAFVDKLTGRSHIPPGQARDVRDINQAAAYGSGKTFEGRFTGQKFKEGLHGVPSKLSSRIDTASVKVGNGFITANTIPDSKGRMAHLIMLPCQPPANAEKAEKAAAASQHLPPVDQMPAGGREVTLGGQTYMLYTAGSEERNFIAGNYAAKKQIQKTAAELDGKFKKVWFRELKDRDGILTGIYEIRTVSEDGLIDTRDWVPLSRYEINPSPQTTVSSERINGITYAVLETQTRVDEVRGKPWKDFKSNPEQSSFNQKNLAAVERDIIAQASEMQALENARAAAAGYVLTAPGSAGAADNASAYSASYPSGNYSRQPGKTAGGAVYVNGALRSTYGMTFEQGGYSTDVPDSVPGTGQPAASSGVQQRSQTAAQYGVMYGVMYGPDGQPLQQPGTPGIPYADGTTYIPGTAYTAPVAAAEQYSGQNIAAAGTYPPYGTGYAPAGVQPDGTINQYADPAALSLQASEFANDGTQLLQEYAPYGQSSPAAGVQAGQTGAYPPGAYPPGVYPQGSYVQGQYPADLQAAGQQLPGTNMPGAYPPGSVPVPGMPGTVFVQEGMPGSDASQPVPDSMQAVQGPDVNVMSEQRPSQRDGMPLLTGRFTTVTTMSDGSIRTTRYVPAAKFVITPHPDTEVSYQEIHGITYAVLTNTADAEEILRSQRAAAQMQNAIVRIKLGQWQKALPKDRQQALHAAFDAATINGTSVADMKCSDVRYGEGVFSFSSGGQTYLCTPDSIYDMPEEGVVSRLKTRDAHYTISEAPIGFEGGPDAKKLARKGLLDTSELSEYMITAEAVTRKTIGSAADIREITSNRVDSGVFDNTIAAVIADKSNQVARAKTEQAVRQLELAAEAEAKKAERDQRIFTPGKAETEEEKRSREFDQDLMWQSTVASMKENFNTAAREAELERQDREKLDAEKNADGTSDAAGSGGLLSRMKNRRQRRTSRSADTPVDADYQELP